MPIAEVASAQFQASHAHFNRIKGALYVDFFRGEYLLRAFRTAIIFSSVVHNIKLNGQAVLKKREEWDKQEAQSQLYLSLRQHYLHQVTRVYSQPPFSCCRQGKILHPQDEKLLFTILKFRVLYKYGIAHHAAEFLEIPTGVHFDFHIIIAILLTLLPQM